MKKITKFIYTIIIVCIITSCNSENAWNCFQSSGSIVQKNIEVTAFDKISVLQRTQLIVSHGEKQAVILETGKNLMNDVLINVKDNTLTIDNTNACNVAREYGITKVYVTTDRLREIRNGSGLSVLSNGILTFPELILRSEDLEEEDQFRKVGDFNLDLQCQKLSIETNGKSNFFLSGTVSELNINFLDGDNRCECDGLEVQDAFIYHRGTNDIFINPKRKATGELRSIGNLILSTMPDTLDVQTFYTGKVIVKN